METVVRESEEVYNLFLDKFGLDEDGDPDAVALFAYALVEKDRIDWLVHHRQQNGGISPTIADVEQWFTSKPPSYFEEKSNYAIGWYKSFARGLLKEEIDQQKKDEVKDYIGTKLGFMSQLWISLASNVIFLILVGALAAYVFADFSPITWVRDHIRSITH